MNTGHPYKQCVFRVIDVETTGFDPEKDRICEIAYTDVVYMEHLSRFEVMPGVGSLCDPGIPIPPTASAIHHITDRMVVDAPKAETLFGEYLDPMHSFVFCAHNAEFDQAFCKRTGWLCTMRLAMHVYPDAPAYKNQVLRYWLGFDELGFPGGHAHSAQFDSFVTATILAHILNTAIAPLVTDAATAQTLIDFAESPVLLQGMLGFGKHHDKAWKDLPYDYMQWMIREDEQTLRRTGKHAWTKDQLHTIDVWLRSC